MHYTMLNDDGWMCAPFLQILANTNDPEQRTQTLQRKVNQKITYAGLHQVNAVFIHLVRLTELLAEPGANWYSVEPGFHCAGEIDPWEDWCTIVERSRGCRYRQWP